VPFATVIRGLCVALFAIAFATLSVRVAVVRAFGERDPAFVQKIWAGHPQAISSLVMTQVGEAALRSQMPPPDVVPKLRELAAKSPLSPEPYLVHGAMESSRGHYGRAETLLAGAVHVAPRSLAARYLLADTMARDGKIDQSLQQLSVLARIAPSFAAPLAPALSQFGATPAGAAHLREVFRRDPQLENSVLTNMASDPRNAELILSIAQHPPGTGGWQQKLVATLVGAGEFRRAHSLWASFAPADERGLAFKQPSKPSPFSWKFAGESSGSAEPVAGRLNIYFSGTGDVDLASRTLLLPAGDYELRTVVAGAAPNSVRWTVTCLPGGNTILELPLRPATSLASRFRVAGNCAAQRLALKGLGQTFPTVSQFAITAFDVKRVSAQ
jgi:hypothetical protein